MEDPFVYGADGVPVGVKPAPRSQLTRSELHDMIVVTSAHNQAEALALVEWLHDSNIPALHRAGQTISFTIEDSAVEILVPRKLAQEAAGSIALFRHEADEHKKRQLRFSEDARVLHVKAARLLAEADNSLRDDPKIETRRKPPVPHATTPPSVTAEVHPEDWATVPIEEPRRKPTAFQLAQRGAGAALLAIGGALLTLELLMNGLKTPLSLVALCLVLLGMALTIKSLPR